jgi:hypothetical protein
MVAHQRRLLLLDTPAASPQATVFARFHALSITEAA